MSRMNLNDYGLCPECTKEKFRKEAENMVNLLGTGPVRCQLALVEFITFSGFNYVTIADLFASESSLVYIPLGGDIKMNALRLIGYVKETRKKDFGLTLEDRIRSHGGTVIPKQEIIGISLVEGEKGKGVAIEYQGGSLILGHDNAPECLEQLVAWQQGKLGDYVDTQGVNLNLGLPSVDKFISGLQSGRILSEITPDTLTEIQSNASYVQNLLLSFDKLSFPQKASSITSVLTLPEDWRELFRTHLKQKKQTALVSAFFLGLGCILLVGVGIYLLSSQLQIESSFVLALFFVIFIFLTGLMSVLNFSDVSKLNHLLALFHPTGER